uniref:Uncharacterized protein n=1 Tax=Cacopsylla melanoneura TaxID=428564 RepID=A0A8D8RQS0_9HEMI
MVRYSIMSMNKLVESKHPVWFFVLETMSVIPSTAQTVLSDIEKFIITRRLCKNMTPQSIKIYNPQTMNSIPTPFQIIVCYEVQVFWYFLDKIPKILLHKHGFMVLQC